MSGEKIQWTRIDEPEFLWGPRPYSAKAGAGGIPRFDMTLAKRVGNPDTAQAVITVTEHGDGEIEFDYECLCGACRLMYADSDQAIKDAVDYNVYGKPEPGTYWVQMRIEEHGGYFEAKEYEVFLEIAE